jgi:ribonuclease PH
VVEIGSRREVDGASKRVERFLEEQVEGVDRARVRMASYAGTRMDIGEHRRGVQGEDQ